MSATSFNLAAVPHAPLLLPAISGASDPCSASRDATSGLLAQYRDSIFVVVSPHAERTGVYASASGDLTRFGLPGVGFSAETSDRAATLAEAWGHPLLNDPVDHGALLPIALAPEASTFVCCGIAESERDGAVELGRELAQSVHRVEWGRDVTFLASAHSAASLTPRAPLTERPEAAAFDAELVRLLTTQPAALAEAESITADLWARGGSCAQGSLAALGEMARLCHVTRFKIVSHEWPVGVGLLVAREVK